MPLRRYGRYAFESSSEKKILFPDVGLTKGDLIDFHERIADWMLPWVRERPLTMQRFPDGVKNEGFYQKRAPDYLPEWIQRTIVPTADGEQEQVVAANRATLAYLADQACITPHVWLSRTDRIERPDLLLFDLDPPAGDFEPVRRAARWVRELLEELELPAYVKTTGSRGLHVLTPLDRRETFDEAREFARRTASVLASRHPDALTTEMRKAARGGRLYLDVTRNAHGQTAVAPYAVRALPGAPVAVPLHWRELSRTALHARTYTTGNVFRRLAHVKDPWEDMSRRACSLRSARARLDELPSLNR